MNANRKNIKTDLRQLDDIHDKDIDYSDIPELDEDFFKQAKIIVPRKKVSLTVRYDSDVIEFFKKSVGKGYQTRMNAILRTYMKAHKNEKRHHS